jgi:serine/threonine protein kinase
MTGPLDAISGQPATVGPLARGTNVGRYLLLDLLGEGGMGVVYKAYDPELGRPVALKLLQTEENASSSSGTDPTLGPSPQSALRDRLLREAQALARLQHPNVIAVHDVGTFRDQVFIAMEFVEGQTVRAWLKAQPRTRRQILDVFLAAGEGLAAAHRAGLIHRDFKPDNVIVGDDGRVRVLDFGLARASDATANANGTVTGIAAPKGRADGAAGGLERVPEQAPRSGAQLGSSQGSKPGDVTVTARSSRPGKRQRPAPSESVSQSGRFTPQLLETPLTHAGAIVGTPRFMAPEQQIDGAVTDAADQFSFSVSLYWALYGEFPYQGIDRTIEGKISAAPAGSTVPGWLREVLARGLLPQPADRFPSMQALLEALRADPAEARRRRLRGALGVIAAAALVIAVAAGGLAFQARRDAAEQARVAQKFGQEVEQIAAIARYAALLPLHDTRQETDFIRARMEQLKERMRRLGPHATGPGHHALGRGYLALEQYDEAVRELEAAWATGYRGPELAYALGLAHGQLYQRELTKLRKTGDAVLDARRRAEIAREHRDPALRYLKLAGAREGEGHLLGGVEAPEYVEGLIALYEQRFADALVLARKAAKRASWLFEARTLEGDIHFVSSSERYLKGDLDGAAEETDRAQKVYHAVVEVAHSSFAALMGECRASLKGERIQSERGQSPEETMKRVLSICSAAETARPDRAAPVVSQASAWSSQGNFQMLHGVDPTAADEAAIHLGERALTIEPRSTEPREVIAVGQLDLADYRLRRGKDPSTALAAAILEAQRMRELDPSSLDAYRLADVAYELRGEYENTHGKDPRGSFRASIESSQRALKVSPEDSTFWNGLGVAHWASGVWERDHGVDPAAAFERSEEAYRRVAQLAPQLDLGAVNLCSTYEDWARFELRRGGDARPKLEQARESCSQAMRIDRGELYAYLYLGRADVDLALSSLERAADPTDLLAQAHAAFKRAAEIDPAYPDTPSESSKALVVEARHLARSGRDPQAVFAKAEESAKRALALAGPTHPDVLRALAEVHRWRAEWRASRHASVASDLRDGLAATGRALAANPSHADSLETEGALHVIAARAAVSPSERRDAAAKARAALERALAISANLEHEIRPLLEEAALLSGQRQ